MPRAIFFATVLALSTLPVSTFAQSEGGGANQDIGQFAEQTGENIQQGASDAASSAGQSVNQTGKGIQEGASNIGSKITEGAKNLVGNIGEKLQELGK